MRHSRFVSQLCTYWSGFSTTLFFLEQLIIVEIVYDNLALIWVLIIHTQECRILTEVYVGRLKMAFNHPFTVLKRLKPEVITSGLTS